MTVIRQLPFREALFAVCLAAAFLALAQLAGSFPLQRATAELAAALLAPFLDLTLRGTVLQIGAVEIAVTEACAGFNTLAVLAPMILGWGVLARANLLVLSAALLPVTILANTLRVLVITALALGGDIALAMGVLHTFSGLVTMVVAVLLLLGVNHAWQMRQQFPLAAVTWTLAGLSLLAAACLAIRTYLQSPLDAWMLPLLMTGMVLAVVAAALPEKDALPDVRWLVAGLVITACGWLQDVQLLTVSGLLLVGFSGLLSVGANRRLTLTAAACYGFSLPGLSQLLLSASLSYPPAWLYAIVVLTVTGIWFAGMRLPWFNPQRKGLVGTVVVFLLIAGIGLMALADRQSDRLPVVTPGYALGDWTGRDVPLALSEETLFAGAQMMKREYVAAAGHVLMLEVKSGKRSHIHPPEYCYASAGWSLSSQPDIHGMSMFLANQDNDHERVAYFFQVNDRVYAGHWLLVAKLRALLTPGDEQWRIIRLATNEQADAANLLANFANQLQTSTN